MNALPCDIIGFVISRTIDSEWMSGRESLEVYADALQAKGCPLRNCVGKKGRLQLPHSDLWIGPKSG